jgi:hypothetical protein
VLATCVLLCAQAGATAPAMAPATTPNRALASARMAVRGIRSGRFVVKLMLKRQEASAGPVPPRVAGSRISMRFPPGLHIGSEIHRPGRYPGWRSGLSAFPFRKEQWRMDRPRGTHLLREMAGTRDVRLPLRGQRRLAHRLGRALPASRLTADGAAGTRTGRSLTEKAFQTRRSRGKNTPTARCARRVASFPRILRIRMEDRREAHDRLKSPHSILIDTQC